MRYKFGACESADPQTRYKAARHFARYDTRIHGGFTPRDWDIDPIYWQSEYRLRRYALQDHPRLLPTGWHFSRTANRSMPAAEYAARCCKVMADYDARELNRAMTPPLPSRQIVAEIISRGGAK